MEGLSADAAREFAVFAEHLNFTRAAEQLHLTQPAVHAKVAKLARRLGCDLYRREGRRLALTREGELVADFGRQVEAMARGLADAVGGGDRRPVVLAAGEGAHLHVIGGAVRRLLASGRPLRLLNLDAAEAVDAVRRGEADLAVTVTAPPDRLATSAIATYPQVLAVGADHRLARERRVSLSDLDGLDLVVPPPGRPLREALERATTAAGVRWRVGVEAEGWQAMLRFVALGVGAAVVNGCVPVVDGVVARPVVDLPEVTYRAIGRPEVLASPRVEPVLRTLRAGAP
jgi:DNA-binding transcriptional LysR family regulator